MIFCASSITIPVSSKEEFEQIANKIHSYKISNKWCSNILQLWDFNEKTKRYSDDAWVWYDSIDKNIEYKESNGEQSLILNITYRDLMIGFFYKLSSIFPDKQIYIYSTNDAGGWYNILHLTLMNGETLYENYIKNDYYFDEYPNEDIVEIEGTNKERKYPDDSKTYTWIGDINYSDVPF